MKMSDLPPVLQAQVACKMQFPRRSKFNVGPAATRTCDGITFDSKAEMIWYQRLTQAVAGKAVQYFLRQVPFHLPGGIVYRCDFMVVYADGRIEFQDVKGVRTAVYTMKKKQVETLYPVTIREVEVK